jgi:hypothetical protein
MNKKLIKLSIYIFSIISLAISFNRIALASELETPSSVSESVETHDHNKSTIEVVITEATCISEGKIEIRCTEDNYVVSTRITAKTSHKMSDWTTYTKATSCLEKDTEISKCTVSGCTYSETRETSNIGPHSEIIQNKKDATCLETGYSGDKYCKLCNKVIEQGEIIAKTGHIPSDTLKNKKDATCWSEGYSGDVVCKYCNTVLENGVTLSKLVHTASEYKENKVEATCSTEGYTGDARCIYCGTIVEQGSKVDKLPHTPVVLNATEETCGQNGYTGDTYCEVCDELLSNGETIEKTLDHDFDDWVTVKVATETIEGAESRQCKVCSYVETRAINKIEPEEKVDSSEEKVTEVVKESVSNKSKSEANAAVSKKSSTKSILLKAIVIVWAIILTVILVRQIIKLRSLHKKQK